MDDTSTFVIVGASLAGAKAAEAAREERFRGRIVLLGAESVLPYERPPLSKDYLRGEVGREAAYVHDQSFYDTHDIELRLGTKVEGLDVAQRTAVLPSGEAIAYDALLLATGAAPRRLPIPGTELAGVHYLRTIDESDRLHKALETGDRLVVVGGGWIGCEVAASARQLGVEVAIVEAGALPLERVLGRELGGFYRDVHVDHGVEFHFQTGIERLRGSSTVEAVELTDGTTLAADIVVIGVGVMPRVELAQSSGLEIDNGVMTDEYLSTTVPGVYAAGDVANAWHPVLDRRIRLEHWSSALHQGPTAAKNILGNPTPYTRIPYFFSDQYDIGMEYSGLATQWDEVVFRGNRAGREFIAFWVNDGRVAAGMNVNVWDVADSIAALVASRQPIDTTLLADPDVDLASLTA